MFKPSRLSLLASGAFALSLTLSYAPPIHANEAGPSTGDVLICDTPEEVEAFLKADSAALPARLAAVNSRFGPQSCNILTAIFYRGGEAKTVLAPEGIVRIIRVALIGYRAGDAWMRMAKPMERYVGALDETTSV